MFDDGVCQSCSPTNKIVRNRNSTLIRLAFIEPGKPMQNGQCESINGKFRDECLSRHYFVSLEDARRIIEAWRIEYKEERSHSALGYQTPQAFRLAWERQSNVDSQMENHSQSMEPTLGEGHNQFMKYM
jgi:hypothetical protein